MFIFLFHFTQKKGYLIFPNLLGSPLYIYTCSNRSSYSIHSSFTLTEVMFFLKMKIHYFSGWTSLIYWMVYSFFVKVYSVLS